MKEALPFSESPMSWQKERFQRRSCAWSVWWNPLPVQKKRFPMCLMRQEWLRGILWRVNSVWFLIRGNIWFRIMWKLTVRIWIPALEALRICFILQTLRKQAGRRLQTCFSQRISNRFYRGRISSIWIPTGDLWRTAGRNSISKNSYYKSKRNSRLNILLKIRRSVWKIRRELPKGVWWSSVTAGGIPSFSWKRKEGFSAWKRTWSVKRIFWEIVTGSPFTWMRTSFMRAGTMGRSASPMPTPHQKWR